MTATHIGFRIAPRINAAGRMDVARHVVELFEAADFASARKLAGILDSRNRERQKKQQEITELAFSEYADHTATDFIVVAGENWHRGVIGLAASRLTEKFHRPSLVLAIENGIAHGSARSIDGFNVVDALAECSDILEQFGGHSAAAGLQMKSDRVGELRERLNSGASKVFFGNEPERVLAIDAPVAASTVTLELHSELAKLEPFGQGNPKPVFSTKGLMLRGEPFVMKEKHLRLNLVDSDGRRHEAVWWSGVEQLSGRTLCAGDYIELAYSLETNTWQGQTRLQLVVKELKADN
jgi:single-stranded-DNA-specific exonuclease